MKEKNIKDNKFIANILQIKSKIKVLIIDIIKN